MGITVVDKPSLVGMDAQIVTVTPDDVMTCPVPEVKALFENALKKNLLEKKPGSAVGFSADIDGEIKTVVFARICDQPYEGGIQAVYAKAVSVAVKMGAKRIFLPLDKALTPQLAAKACETALIASYSFETYKSKKSDEIEFTAFYAGDFSKQLAEAILLAQSTNLARDLVNEPADVMTPKALAEAAKKLADECGIEADIRDEKGIAELGMGSYLAVARGGANRPYLITLRYKGNPASDEVIALVGKGMTYDSGGYCLKPVDGMYTMKCDMGGAAAVIATMRAIAKSGLKANVTAIVAACENMISGEAYRPGEVLKSMNGKTVEVINTDAEGRLTLIDAVTYAVRKESASRVIDIATLTGSAVVSLGNNYMVVMADDDKLYDALSSASKASAEKIWRMPCDEEFTLGLKSDIADLKHMGGREGGTLSAGMFIREFAEGKPWAHLDIAGPAFTKTATDLFAPGGTGSGVRLLYHTVRELAK